MQNIVFKYASLVALAGIAITLIIHALTGNNPDPKNPLNYLGFLTYVVHIVCIVYALKERKSAQKGVISYGQGLGTGTLVSLLAGVLMALFTYVQLTVINPDMISKIKALQEQKMEEAQEKNNLTDEQMAMAKKTTTMFMNVPFMATSSFLGVFFAGFIGSLVVAGVMKKDAPMFTDGVV